MFLPFAPPDWHLTLVGTTPVWKTSVFFFCAQEKIWVGWCWRSFGVWVCFSLDLSFEVPLVVCLSLCFFFFWCFFWFWFFASSFLHFSFVLFQWLGFLFPRLFCGNNHWGLVCPAKHNELSGHAYNRVWISTSYGKTALCSRLSERLHQQKINKSDCTISKQQKQLLHCSFVCAEDLKCRPPRFISLAATIAQEEVKERGKQAGQRQKKEWLLSNVWEYFSVVVLLHVHVVLLRGGGPQIIHNLALSAKEHNFGVFSQVLLTFGLSLCSFHI